VSGRVLVKWQDGCAPAPLALEDHTLMLLPACDCIRAEGAETPRRMNKRPTGMCDSDSVLEGSKGRAQQQPYATKFSTVPSASRPWARYWPIFSISGTSDIA